MATISTIAVAAFAAALGVGAQPALADSLEDATEKAVRTHPTVMAARAFKDSAGENVGQAKAGLFPTIDFRGTSGYARTNNSTTRGVGGHSQASAFMWRGESSLTFSQLLWDGWSTSNSVGAAEARVDVSQFQVLNAGEQIGLRAVSSYLDLDRNRELVRLAGENVEVHDKLVKDVKLKAKSGGGNEADVNQAEARLALAGATVDQFKGTLKDAEAAYLEVIGEQPGDTVRPPIPAPEAVPADVDSAVKVAMANSPTVNTAVANVAAMKKELASARASLMPRLTFDLGGARNENAGGAKGPNNDFTAQLVLTYNLFRGGGDGARIRSTSALLREATLREREARRTVAATTRFSYHALVTARDRLPTLRDHVSASDKVVKAFTEQFKLGKRSLLDLLDVEGELFQAKGALVNGEVALMVAHYRVLATMGELRKTMGIESAAVGGTDAATMVASAPPAKEADKEAAAVKTAKVKAAEKEAAKVAEAKTAEAKAAKEAAAKQAAIRKAAEVKAAEREDAKLAEAKAAEEAAAKEAAAKKAAEAKAAEMEANKLAAAKVAEEAAEAKAAKAKAAEAKAKAAEAKAAEAKAAETESAEARIVPPSDLLVREAAETAKREKEHRLAVEREAELKAEIAEAERKAEAARRVAEAERKAAEAERKAAAAAEAERQAAAAAAVAAKAREQKAAEAAAAMKKAAAAQAQAKKREIAAATPKRAFSKVPQGEALEAGLNAYMVRDYRVAMDYWLPQARADDADAQFLVGGLYHDGAGVMADPVAAYFWWALAAHKGHGKAERMLAALVTEMRPDQVTEARRLRRDWRPVN